ncbi:Microtubule-associated protein 70 [Dillenia turbinata]|uniref:Microtubule-associated protein 70 n=1 Tax=Dillenia turbinata TaxID=194707 RepID=A0AAN8YZG3_9MAGN
MVMSFEEVRGEEHYLVPSDPIVFELNRLQNQLKEKERELGAANVEIKALKATEVLKDKALEELGNEVEKLDGKLRVTENLLEQKNLEIKKLADDKKEALAAQYAAEATLRRVHATQKDDDSLPIETIIAPFEADIKMYKNEIAALQEDKTALERLTKLKEAALLEAERILRTALERALIVEEVQNQNFELKRQIEEENRILERNNRQKVAEVEKLSQTIRELEEAILTAGAAANAIRDFQRQVYELQEEKRTLERELARAKITANRVATVVANEWKDESEKVMPVKQWLEERRLLQAEMQRLKDKLAVSERTAKAEAQLKEKLKLRLKTLEDGLKSLSCSPNALCTSPKFEKSNHILGFLSSNVGLRKMSTSLPRASTTQTSSSPQQPKTETATVNDTGEVKHVSSLKKKGVSGENLLKKSLWAAKTKILHDVEKKNTGMKANPDGLNCGDDALAGENKTKITRIEGRQSKGGEIPDNEDVILMKKVEALTKSTEVEFKKSKREAAARKKEALLHKTEENNANFTKSSSPQFLNFLFNDFAITGSTKHVEDSSGVLLLRGNGNYVLIYWVRVAECLIRIDVD